MALSVLPIGLVSVTAASAPLRVATLADLHYFAEADMGNIRIELSEAEDAVGYGDFIVSVGTSEEDMLQAGTFKNIGRYYAQYASSSADTPITPLTFKANTEEANTVFEIRSLTGLSF